MKRFLTLIMLMVLMVPSVLRGQTADAVAEVYAKQLDSQNVEVVWSWDEIVPQAVVIDFETGDFSQGAFTNDATFPWEITQDAYEGNYAVKTTMHEHGLQSYLELTVEVPYDNAVLSFYHKVESESGYDGTIFYLDGESRTSLSGMTGWQFAEVPVSAGVHTYSWCWLKDSYGDEGDVGADAYWLDNIVPFAPGATVEEGWLYYDDGYFSNAIGMGEAGYDNYWAVSFPDMSAYAGQTLTKLAVLIYQGTNVTATVCLGGVDAPGTVMATQEFTATPGEFVEINLDTPVAIDGTEPLWIIMYCNDGAYPCASSAYCGDPNSSWFMMEGAWYDVSLLGVSPMTWMIRGFVEDAQGRTVAMSQGEFAPASNVTADAKVSVLSPERKKIFGTPSRNAKRSEVGFNLYKYNIFTGGEAELIAENITDTSYVDNAWVTTEPGIYQWGVAVLKEARKANRGDILNLDFEDGVMPEGWVVTSSLGYPTLGEWGIRSGFSSYNFPPIGLNSLYSEGGNYNAFYNLITTAIDLTATTNPILSFDYGNPDWTGDLCVLNVKVATSPDGPWTTVWTTGGSSKYEWTSTVADLSAYAGQAIYLNFENEDHYGYGICIDNIKISGEGGDDPFNPTQGEIVWSNTLEKDMFTTVNVSVELNTDENVKGTEVTFVNISEPGMGYDYTVELDETGMYSWTEFRRGVYKYSVYKRGYESCATEEEVVILDEETFECTLTETVNNVENLYVSPLGLAMWEGDEVITLGDEFKYDFEDGTTAGWTLIDADGDGFGWTNTNETLAEPIGYNSSNSIISASFVNNYGPLYPDNYIVTAEKYLIGGASQLTFMVSPLDPNWPNEHYGVAVSTTGNTSPADFEMVWEETLLRGSNNERDANAVRGQKRTSTWYMKTVDLSAYAGQEVYIALRHFNCSDIYMICVDDVALTNAAKASRVIESYTISLNGVEEATVTDKFYQHENVTPGETYTTTVVANYSSGTSAPAEYTWTCADCSEYQGAVEYKAEWIPGTNKATLSWILPEQTRGGEWLTYDNGTNEDAIGLSVDGATFMSFEWGVMFPAENMAGTAQNVTKVKVFDAETSVHSGTLRIYEGGTTSPTTLLHSQDYTLTGSNEYVEIELNQAVQITGTESLWVTLYNNDGDWVAPYCSNGDIANARWVNLPDYGGWLDAASLGAGLVAWQISAYVTDGGGDEPEPTGAIVGVNVYCDGELITEQPVTTDSYTAILPDKEVHEYCIRVVYDDYGMSCAQCAEVLDQTSVNENGANAMSIYPNPVKDNLTIAAEAMTRITITNTLGQVMFDEQVVSNNEVINVSQYEAGVYVVRIATENGVSVERITVIK